MRLEFDPVIRLSHSRMKAWRRCQMEHHYKYVQKLKRKTKARPLYLGSAVHELIEEQLETGSFETKLAEIRKEFNKLFEEEREMLGPIPDLAGDIVTRYFKQWADDGLEYPRRRWGRRTEYKVEFYLDNHTQFIGFIDAYPQDSMGRNWLMDHKTCRNIPDENARFFDLQLLLYVWALPQLGYPKPDGVIWDYIRTKPPAIPERLVKGGFSKAKNIDTTYDVYMKTIIDELGPDKAQDYLEFAETLRGKEDKFNRRIYLPSPSVKMVENVVADFRETAWQIRTLGPTAKVRNMTRDCRMCSFQPLCNAEVRGLDTDFILKTEYERKDAEENPQENDDSADTDE